MKILKYCKNYVYIIAEKHLYCCIWNTRVTRQRWCSAQGAISHVPNDDEPCLNPSSSNLHFPRRYLSPLCESFTIWNCKNCHKWDVVTFFLRVTSYRIVVPFRVVNSVTQSKFVRIVGNTLTALFYMGHGIRLVTLATYITYVYS